MKARYHEQGFNSQSSGSSGWQMPNKHNSAGGSYSPQSSGSFRPRGTWISMMDHLKQPKTASFMPSQSDKSYVDQRTKDYIEQATERFQDPPGVQSGNPYYGQDVSKIIPESTLKRMQYEDDEFDESLRGVAGKPYYNPKFDRRYQNPEMKSCKVNGNQFQGASGKPHYYSQRNPNQGVETMGGINREFGSGVPEVVTPSYGATSQFSKPSLGIFRQPNHSTGFGQRHCDQGTNRGMNGTGVKIGQHVPNSFTPSQRGAGEFPGASGKHYFKGMFDKNGNQGMKSPMDTGLRGSVPENHTSLLDHVFLPPLSATKLTYDMYLDNNNSINRPEGELIAETRRTKLYGRDLGTLRSGGDGWLTDSVIDLYMEMIQWRYRFVHAFPSSFFAMLMSPDGLNAVREAATEIDIFKFDLLFIPVCQHNHWRLLVVHVPEKTIVAFNSLPGSTDKQNMDMLETWLNGEARRRDALKYQCPWRKRQEGVPAQDNYHDCGVFLLQFARYICKGRQFNFTAEHMKYFRERIMHECVKMKLLPD